MPVNFGGIGKGDFSARKDPFTGERTGGRFSGSRGGKGEGGGKKKGKKPFKEKVQPFLERTLPVLSGPLGIPIIASKLTKGLLEKYPELDRGLPPSTRYDAAGRAAAADPFQLLATEKSNLMDEKKKKKPSILGGSLMRPRGLNVRRRTLTSTFGG